LVYLKFSVFGAGSGGDFLEDMIALSNTPQKRLAAAAPCAFLQNWPRDADSSQTVIQNYKLFSQIIIFRGIDQNEEYAEARSRNQLAVWGIPMMEITAPSILLSPMR
jgi:hypothetical protein